MHSVPKRQQPSRPRRTASQGIGLDVFGPGQEVWTATTQEVVAMLGRKWVLPVVCELGAGSQRHFQLRNRVKGVSSKVLTETLRFLERNGVIAQVLHHDGHGATSVAYQLTDLGRSLDTPVGAIYRWGRDHLDDVARSRQDVDARWAGGEIPRGARGRLEVPKNPLK